MNESKNNLLVPAAIVIAGALIAGGIYFGGGINKGTANPGTGPTPEELAENVKPINKEDYVIGNANAPIAIIEFSDLECPFCKTFHNTMHQVMDAYGNGGQVAWVYRHFPLAIHPKAADEAHAAECVGSIAGNEVFWKYVDRIFAITPSNNQLDLAELPKIARELGVDAKKFDDCMKAGTFKQKIQAQSANAAEAGAQGTPFAVIVSKKGDFIPLGGAYPLEDMKRLIDELLAK